MLKRQDDHYQGTSLEVMCLAGYMAGLSYAGRCVGDPCNTIQEAPGSIIRTMAGERAWVFLDRPRAETRLAVAFSAVLPPLVGTDHQLHRHAKLRGFPF